MAGKTPHEAVTNYVTPLSLALSCVTTSVLNVAGGYKPGNVHVAHLSGSPTKLSGEIPLTLSVRQNYRIVEDELPRGPWKVSIVAYSYVLAEPEGAEFIAYHWHPLIPNVSFPHLHLQSGLQLGFKRLQGVHIPTHRIAVEDVLRFVITELGVTPRRADWSEILDSSQAAFETWRTWSGSTP